ncbi:dipeptide ABC transporter ATP-binding protein [Sinomonas atrocyanea]|uniref:dipeptide ABC transporter ATP-binding protein n=1 Tax=Sinomonas atrocyanea TaxID=37927 RepID=UPI003D972AEA
MTDRPRYAAAREAAPVLEVRGLSVDFGVDRAWVAAAQGLDFEVRAGEVLAIVGESGSGKSASSMALLGLLPPNSRVSGSVRLAGEELFGPDRRRLREARGRDIAMVFQEPMSALNPVSAVGAQIVEAVRLHTPLPPREARVKALALLETVGLGEAERIFRSYPHQLSGGQLQRVLIAQSLSCSPKLLIADEPTTALDVTVQAEILSLLRSLKDSLGAAVLLITHDMGVVADLADRVAVMRAGRIVETGTAARVFRSPQHAYTRALLEAVPRLGQGGRRSDDGVDPTAALAAAAGVGLEEAEPRGLSAREREAAPPPAEALGRRATRGVPVLELRGAVVEYPSRGRGAAFRAVHGVDLAVHPGEVLGLVGESGSGKTTVGRAAVGLLAVAEGSLTVVGQEIAGLRRNARRLREVRRSVGMVFQDPSSSLNPRLPVGESIGEPLLLSGTAKGARLHARVEALLDQVELPRSYRNRYPHELSGGQRQRVGIARALALEPKLMVADEPTSALDVSVQAKVIDLFAQLQREHGFACLFVSHDLAVVDILADYIAVMRGGRIVEQGPRDSVLRSPREPYTERLLAAVPLPDPERQRERRELRELLAGRDPESTG